MSEPNFKIEVSQRIGRLPPYLFGRINKMKYEKRMAGANAIRVPLGNDQAFLDKIEKVIEGLYPTPKLLILNYPHNPTAMTIDPGFWERAIEMCRRHKVMIISDFAYGEVCFDGYRAPSFLSAEGAKDLGVEFTTLSKSYNMAC